jgi:hypothetical protein
MSQKELTVTVLGVTNNVQASVMTEQVNDASCELTLLTEHCEATVVETLVVVEAVVDFAVVVDLVVEAVVDLVVDLVIVDLVVVALVVDLVVVVLGAARGTTCLFPFSRAGVQEA